MEGGGGGWPRHRWMTEAHKGGAAQRVPWWRGMNLEFKQWVVGYALEANCREFVLWQGVGVHSHKLWAIKVQQRSIESMGDLDADRERSDGLLSI